MIPRYPVVKNVEKTPRETKWFRMDWGGTVLAPETITDSAWSVSGGIVLETDGITGNETRALVSGGVTGVVAKLTNLITVDTGEVLEAVFELDITK
jgi:hypothetical protein